MRTNKGHLCGVCYCKRISHHHLSLVDSKAGGGVVKQYSEKQEGFIFVPFGSEPERSRAPSVELTGYGRRQMMNNGLIRP